MYDSEIVQIKIWKQVTIRWQSRPTLICIWMWKISRWFWLHQIVATLHHRIAIKIHRNFSHLLNLQHFCINLKRSDWLKNIPLYDVITGSSWVMIEFTEKQYSLLWPIKIDGSRFRMIESVISSPPFLSWNLERKNVIRLYWFQACPKLA